MRDMAMAVKPLELTTPFIGVNFGYLKNLKREQKIQLLSRLAREVAESSEEQHDSLCLVDKFCGAWKSEKTAEDIAMEIKKARVSSNAVEEF